MASKKKAEVVRAEVIPERVRDIERFLVAGEKTVKAVEAVTDLLRHGVEKVIGPQVLHNLEQEITALRAQNDVMHEVLSALVEEGHTISVRSGVRCSLEIIVGERTGDIVVRRKR